ncbi:MAG: RtcB family protein [Anaerolineales bacterium]
MVRIQDMKQINEYEWEIPKSFRSDMRVPVRIFATRILLEAIMDDKSLEQAVNTATLPGLVGNVLVMPDMHQGYGFPIGGVAATKLPDGVISPGAIGYDINCGVRLLGSQIEYEEAAGYLDDLASALYHNCPSGVGTKGHLRLSEKELDQVCREGARWALKKGYASENDLRRTEEAGFIEGADPSKVSKRAKQRGRPQVGTLGAGNHFIEIERVDQIFASDAAQAMGLQEGMRLRRWDCRRES